MAIAHNGNITNAETLRDELAEKATPLPPLPIPRSSAAYTVIHRKRL
jgi:glutamine phosphoribosylpyrophosphate amidotransferase